MVVYDAGWTEAAYNPQKSNYGRGGAEMDAIKGEAQDYSGRNNANASTPSDGRSPRIRLTLCSRSWQYSSYPTAAM